MVLLVCVPQLPSSMGRNGVLGAYAASGAAAAAAAGVTQLIFGRRAQPRTVASAAVMGLLLMLVRPQLLPRALQRAKPCPPCGPEIGALHQARSV